MNREALLYALAAESLEADLAILVIEWGES